MRILAIDPGPDKSAFVLFDWPEKVIQQFGHVDNEELLVLIQNTPANLMAIEEVSYYGPDRSIGATTIDTARWVGRFQDRVATRGSITQGTILIKNQKVRVHMCGLTAVTKSAVHHATKDRFPRTGGGATPCKGTKGQPGPLYGMAGPHMFDALAIGITGAETLVPGLGMLQEKP